MGLSLKSIDRKGLIDHFAVGSYSGVHAVRRELTVLFALRVFDDAQEISDPEDRGEADCLIENALAYADIDLLGGDCLTREAIVGELSNPAGGIGIDYEAFNEDYQRFLARTPGPVSDQAAAMIGLYKFVNHSDCDGRHSYGDAVDILQFFDFVGPMFKESSDADYYRNLHAFFRNTVENNGYVIYA
jgi:hypothetical protein